MHNKKYLSRFSKAVRFLSCFPGLLMLTGLVCAPTVAKATEKEFRVAIMQAQKGAAQKFRPLEAYLKTHGVNIQLVGAASYQAAANMFADGRVDGMFSGSGVAGIMLLKDLAYPVLRPVDRNGHSTYRAVILAPANTPVFSDAAKSFRGKRVICCSLASSGEFYFRSLPGLVEGDVNLITAPSHGAAIAGLAAGAADIAIVKNRVWDSVRDRYPQLVQIGEDHGENPDNTLIIAKNTDPDLVKKITAALFALKDDTSPAAEAVRLQLGIEKYIPTSRDNFSHTLSLLKNARIGPDFNFSF